MSCKIPFETLQAQLGVRVEINPDTGNSCLAPNFNDVRSAIEMLGSIDVAAQKLNVQSELVNIWIDEHYVPTKQAEVLSSLTGIGVFFLQTPSCYYVDEVTGQYWPPTGFIARRENEWIDLDDIEEYRLLHS
jgi:hypothetical protein